MYARLRQSAPVKTPVVPVKPPTVTTPVKRHRLHAPEPVHPYVPYACRIDALSIAPRQWGVLGFTSDRRAVWPLTTVALEHLTRMGVATVRLFIVAAGGWTEERRVSVDAAAKLLKRFGERHAVGVR